MISVFNESKNNSMCRQSQSKIASAKRQVKTCKEVDAENQKCTRRLNRSCGYRDIPMQYVLQPSSSDISIPSQENLLPAALPASYPRSKSLGSPTTTTPQNQTHNFTSEERAEKVRCDVDLQILLAHEVHKSGVVTSLGYRAVYEKFLLCDAVEQKLQREKLARECNQEIDPKSKRKPRRQTILGLHKFDPWKQPQEFQNSPNNSKKQQRQLRRSSLAPCISSMPVLGLHSLDDSTTEEVAINIAPRKSIRLKNLMEFEQDVIDLHLDCDVHDPFLMGYMSECQIDTSSVCSLTCVSNSQTPMSARSSRLVKSCNEKDDLPTFSESFLALSQHGSARSNTDCNEPASPIKNFVGKDATPTDRVKATESTDDTRYNLFDNDKEVENIMETFENTYFSDDSSCDGSWLPWPDLDAYEGEERNEFASHPQVEDAKGDKTMTKESTATPVSKSVADDVTIGCGECAFLPWPSDQKRQRKRFVRQAGRFGSAVATLGLSRARAA